MATLRKFPYPFKAMLGFSTDIGSPQPYVEGVMRFLNTEETIGGEQGVGLDVATSMWFVNGDTPSHPNYEAMCWFNGVSGTEQDATAIKKYMESGWVDSIHTYGSFDEGAWSRAYAVQAANAIGGYAQYLRHWIDNGGTNNKQNFVRSDIMTYMEGDDPTKTTTYHTDITVGELGVAFGWGHRSWQFGFDTTVEARTLKDGNKLWRYTRFVGGNEAVSSTWQWYNDKLHLQLSTAHLDALTANQQMVIVGQHLDKRDGVSVGDFTADGMAALRDLRSRQDAGDILVARCSRLLDYDVAYHGVQWTEPIPGTVNVASITDAVRGDNASPTVDDLRGLTWYVPSAASASLTINGTPVSESDIIRAESDGTGESIGIRWWDYDRTDYTVASEPMVTGRIQPASVPLALTATANPGSISLAWTGAGEWHVERRVVA